MMSNTQRLIVAAVLVGTTSGLAAQPALAKGQPSSQPTQTIRNLSLKLPIGTIELADANLQVKPGKDNQPEGFRGTARVKLPAVGPLAHLKMSDLLRADVGLDKGATLTSFGAPLDPDRRYFFLDFGGGLNLSREFEDDAGVTQTVDLSVPPGQRVVLILDPEQPLMFVQGKIRVSYTGDLAVIGDLLAARGINMAALDNVQFPGVGTIVISATLAPGTDKSFIELKAGTGVSAGAIGAAISVQAEPLTLEGGARIDKDGVTITGVTTSRVAPDAVLDGSGKVQMRVPFDGQQPFVDLTGALSVPLAQVQTEGSQRLSVDCQAVANAVQATAAAAATVAKSAGNVVTVTVGSALAAAGGAASGAARFVGNVFTVTVESAAQAGGSAVAGVSAGVSNAVSNTIGAAPTTVASASAAAGSGWQSIMQQVCKATGRC